MDPVYTLIMLTGVASCAALLRRSQRALPIAGADRLALGVAAFCGAMIGAKLPFVLSGEGHGYGAWFSDGKTILAGLVGGYLAVELAKLLLGVRTKTGDTWAAPVALGVAIGRLGCFRAGCCYGAPTELPWGVVFPATDALPRHPTQLYESAFHLAMFGVLTWLAGRRAFPGQLLKLYIIAYAAYRFATEFIRPEPAAYAGLTTYQWASLGIIAVFAVLWRYDARVADRSTPSA